MLISYIDIIFFLFLPAEAQNALESQDCQTDSEPPRKRKARTCQVCGQPRRGHPRNRCLASSATTD